MPIYEYRCGACGHHLEALQKMSEGPLRKCPDCGKSQLRRLMSAPQFRLKGEGWYETDFKNKNETKRNLVGADSADGDGKSGNGADAATKPDATKPDATKPDATKEGAVAKTDGADAGSAKPKADAVKTGARTKKAATKSRATRSARR
jgi:putative FmdB family regulatory protein